MADFTAKDVQNLRQLPGAGMMDAKKALVENDGDAEAAAQWLREKGIRAVRVEGEDELIALTVRERPLMALNSRGNYVHPLFSLGYDAILTLMRILEVISKNNVRPEDILTETRRSLNARRVKLPPEELRGREDYLSFMGGYRGRSGEALILDPHDPDTMIAISNRT
jgi:hypothetical protein